MTISAVFMGFHSQRLNPLELKWTTHKIGRKQDWCKMSRENESCPVVPELRITCFCYKSMKEVSSVDSISYSSSNSFCWGTNVWCYLDKYCQTLILFWHWNPAVGCNAASVVQYSSETGNREWPRGWREIKSKQKNTFFCGYTEVV